MMSNNRRRRNRGYSNASSEDRMSPTTKYIREWNTYSPPRNDRDRRDSEHYSDDDVNPSRSRNSSESSDEGKDRYAGAKFNCTPHPSMLPMPPLNWIEDAQQKESRAEPHRLEVMSLHLRQLLKVSV